MTNVTESFISSANDNSRYRLYIALFIMCCVAISWLGVIDQKSTAYIDEALVQAGVAFAGSKVLNSILAMLQSIEFSIGFASLGFGEVLSPINDLVENYADLMKLAIGSLFIQKILLGIVSDSVFKIVLTISGLLAAGAVYFQHAASQLFLLRFFLFTLFLRFSLVIMVMLNGIADHLFLNEQTEQELQQVAQIEEAESKLSVEQRQVLIEEISVLKKTAEELLAQRSEKLSLQEQIKIELEKADQKIADLKKELPVFQLINRDPRLVALETEQKAIKTQMDELVKEIRELEREQTRVTKEIEFAQLTLEGKADGFFGSIASSFTSGIAGVRDAISLDKIAEMKEKLDSMFSTFLKIMALFLLKTLIFPLLFLFAITRAFKTVWQIDPARYLPALGRISNSNKAS
ncbi:MAG: hypothetical protein ACK4ML_03785 [Alishewanella aestuarii]